MSSIILDINKYSQEVILKGEEYRKKEMKIYLWLLVFSSIGFITILYVIKDFFFIILGLLSLLILYLIVNLYTNYRLIKYLQRNIIGYKFCFLNVFKFDWNDPILQITWLQRVKKRISQEKVSKKKIKNSKFFYQNKQRGVDFFWIKLCSLFIGTMSSLFALKSENETIDITVKWVLIVLVVIFAFLEILERRNIIYDNNNYKRMETLCERLLEE